MFSRSARWLDRHPFVAPFMATLGFLGLFQSVFLLGRFRQMTGGLQMAMGLTRLGLAVGLVTALALVPLALLIRRRLPAWRRGDRHLASWAACIGLAAAVVGWTLADSWASGPWVPDALEPWFAATMAILFGLASTWIRPSQRWVRVGAAVAPLLFVISALPIGGYGPTPDAAEAPIAATPEVGMPDVVLVSIDTLRADRLGAYGGDRNLTPEMDRVAEEGVVFQRALATSPWTIPSVASMLTGLSTLTHGAGWPLGSGPTYQRSSLEGDFTTLAERLSAAGYRTRAVVANGFLNPWTGIGQGFQEFQNPFFMASFATVLYELPLTRLIVALTPPEVWGDYRAQAVTDQALAWLTEDDPAPLFLWVHYIDPHSPYQADPAALESQAIREMANQEQPPVLADGTVVGEAFVATDLVRSGSVWLGPRDRERLEDYYDRAVRYVDENIGRLFGALRDRANERQVIAALTSDHGEEFWDHGHFEHGHDYFREITQIPLVFWSPDRIPSGRGVTDLVGLLDVAPTLLALAGLEPTTTVPENEGRSLAPLWQVESGAETSPPSPRFSEGSLYGLPAVLVEEGPWRFVLRANDQAELYHLIRDPGERYNVVSQFPEIAERFRGLVEPRLTAYLEGGSDQERRELSPEEIRALEALGYVN